MPGPTSLATAFASAPSVAPAPRGFAELDERIAAASPGVVLVRAPKEISLAVVAHVVRRVQSISLNALVASIREGAPLFRDAAVRLGVGNIASAPEQTAEQIASAASEKRTVLVGRLPERGSWDAAVLDELTRKNAFAVFVTESETEIEGSEVFTVGAHLDGDERARWWSAVADEADALVSKSDWNALTHWWETARRTPATPPAARPALSAEASKLLAAFALVACPWSALRVSVLGPATALDELVDVGAVAIERGLTVVSEGWLDEATRLASTATLEERRAAAHALLAGPEDGDPWAFARAAELLLGAGEPERADEAHARAAGGLEDLRARGALLARWVAAVDSAPQNAQLALRISAAERALEAGDADAAQRWAQSAASLAPQDPKVALLMGRAALGLGDLVAAKVALEQGLALGADDDLAAAVGAELAEVDYLVGQLANAVEQAQAAITKTQNVATRLRARNVIGKVLLAESKWDEADRHFAQDELTASVAGLITCEFRARTNRAIAVLSRGQIDEARALFETVLAEGERAREPRASEYALSNLAVVAIRQHRYFDALALWERTLRMRQSLHDRVATAQTVVSLVDLRLRLGLVDHAEQALTFVRRALGRGMRPTHACAFAVQAARIALARNDSFTARRELSRAISSAESVSPYHLGEAHRLAARVALEDGDVLGAAEAIAKAAELATKDFARAEVAILRAHHARAAGEYSRDLALEAVTLARASEDEELLREALGLLARVLVDLNERDAARAHIEQAITVRDRVAADLQGEVRSAYLAKPQMVELEKLLRAVQDEPEPSSEEAPRTQRSSTRAAAHVPREIIGDDPAIRGLVAAIKKVGRSDSTVLIRGESGTGKELVAEALHRASDRAGGPFVAVNCAALVETLLLSELFGHEKGAFTGAAARRRGRFELAEGGTLFLDEIGDISPRTQVALLRVLQEKTFERVGGTTAIRANVRIVCATHRDLKAMVERGEFREDLYYRLRGITLEVPALRQRLGDLPRIAEHLLLRVAAERGEQPKSLSPEAIELLQRHRWQGNVRELENALRAASLFADGTIISAADLVDNVEDLKALAQQRASSPPPRPSFVSVPSIAPVESAADVEEEVECTGEGPLPTDEASATAAAYSQVRNGSVSLSDMKRQIERDCIARALAETRGNITRAAALLGMKRPRLSQLVKQYGLAAVSSEDA